MSSVPFIVVTKKQMQSNELRLLTTQVRRSNLKKPSCNLTELQEEKCASVPTGLNICLYSSARVSQLPGKKSGCTIYCGLQSVACGFPVFVMLETEQKGVSRLWSSTLSEISPKRVNLNVLLLGCILPPWFFFFSFCCAPKVSGTCRNNTNLFTRLSNAEYWRVEISRNHTEGKTTDKLHQVGHDV